MLLSSVDAVAVVDEEDDEDMASSALLGVCFWRQKKVFMMFVIKMDGSACSLYLECDSNAKKRPDEYYVLLE